MATIDRAIEIAVKIHKDQTDKGGSAYILHPLRVMMQMKTEEEMIVGVLHDVIEDSYWTLKDLVKEGFSDEIVRAIGFLTKYEGDDYEKYIELINIDRLARKAKIEDLRDNIDITRLKNFGDKDVIHLQKYLKALNFLLLNKIWG